MAIAAGIRLSQLDATRLSGFANEWLRRAEVLAETGRTLVSLLHWPTSYPLGRSLPSKRRERYLSHRHGAFLCRME